MDKQQVIIKMEDEKKNNNMKERPTEGMPDMMPKGTVDHPPQKDPQNIPERMEEQPYMQDGEVVDQDDLQQYGEADNDDPGPTDGKC